MTDESFKSGKPPANVANPAKKQRERDWNAPLHGFPSWVDLSGLGEMPDPRLTKIESILGVTFEGFSPSKNDLGVGANIILAGYEGGSSLTHPSNQASSDLATERQIRRLQKLSDDLVNFISTLNAPARDSLSQHRVDITALQDALRDVSDNASAVFEDAAKGFQVNGRPLDHVATEVTAEAAFVFQHLTGQIPTFVTDPETSKISGLWPSMLGAIFEALQISASVEASIRKHKKLGRKAL
jgi:hypothetical protein